AATTMPNDLVARCAHFFELIDEIDRVHGLGADLDARLARYAALDHDVIRLVGGDKFAPAPLYLLGGRQLAGRAVSFCAGRPRPETQALLNQVGQVLAEYRDQLPLTLRQVFYRLVGAYAFEKTEKAYARLGEALNKARRARFIDMDAIRDDGFTSAAS